ncbi:MAG: FeoC-like transcriptional regulator [Candidatus Omnitrophica bacterium]|nr:FeoC-like transcriptional regulator [Candidatus Omnitrophota bacterium]
MLIKIKELFEKQKILSLEELSTYFQVEPTAMEKMLDILVEKGFIQKKVIECKTTLCADCAQSCGSAKLVFFEKL